MKFPPIFTANFWLQPIDNSPLVLFRILFGFLLFAEGLGAIVTGWVNRTFVQPEFTFNFIGLDFLQVFVGPQMYVLYGLLVISGLMVMLGAYYRVAMFTYALLWTISYLAQKTSYNNHYYLLVLLCWVMVFMPAHRYASYDVKRKPDLLTLSCPRWTILFFIIQLWIVYTYASIAKMYPDWLNAEPIKIWFAGKRHYFLIGEWLQSEWVQYNIAYGGIIFDMLIIPLLLWRKTRVLAACLSVFFHLSNSAIFQIGVFPYLMLATLILFFPPEVIRQRFFKQKPPFQNTTPPITTTTLRQKITLGMLGLYFIIQIALPLRHHRYEGNVLWTEEGHRMAWRMMLRSKAGTIYYTVKIPNENKQWIVHPKNHLTRKQTAKLPTRPDAIWQFAQFLKKKYQKEGYEHVEVYATVRALLNQRPLQKYIDDTVDLANTPWQRFQHDEWILPLKKD